MGFISLIERFGDLYVELLSLSEDVHTLVVGGWDSLMLMDLESPQQYVVGKATAVDDMELVYHPH